MLLSAAAALMALAAVVNATISVPHLREDMAEINVRPTLLAAVSLGLHFGTIAMFAFAGLVLVAAVRSPRGVAAPHLPLGIIGAAYGVFGLLAVAWSRSPHALGYLLMGVLVLAASLIREPRPQ